MKNYHEEGDYAMGFVIKNIRVGGGLDPIHIRGADDGCVEFFKINKVINKDTGEESEIQASYKFYSSLEAALDKVFRMRVCNRDAKSLEELIANVKEERIALHEEFASTLLSNRRRR
jgi:hypothetical protein